MAARLAAIVDSSDDAIVSKDLFGVITSWNPAAERMFGYSAAEAVGQPIYLIIPADRQHEEEGVLRRIRAGHKVHHFDTVRVAKDGRLVPVSLTVSPVRSAGGDIIGASKIARDITGRQLAEQERTVLLAREQTARADAEALNRTKDEFLATLSHELRTPLNAIFGWARMLQTGTVTGATAQRAVEAIVRNATAQVQLIDELLDVSRIITGNMRLDLRPVDIHAVIETALDAVRPAAANKGLRIETMLDPRAGPVTGDPNRLRQVVWNLLSNAVKFTPAPGRVQVRLQRVSSRVEIVVSDTGQGIAPDVLPYVFDRFRQGDSSITRRHGGLGLGLSLVRHLVDLHGGTVTGHSPGVGEGATFVVTLPAPLSRSDPHEGQPTAAAPQPVTSLAPLRGVRVLLVDDDPESLDITTVILTSAGADTRTCVSAAAARDILQAWEPHVLISGIEMPDEDSYTFLRSVRAGSAARSKILAIALTAYGRPEDRLRTLAASFNYHLSKPVDPAELSQVIATLAQRSP
ncbi:MAG TPA: ATP-binding protein [Candidatus Limnocylindria bacterium]|nr:ATP-binding protein [Candidatus Limnocylindria bacterium]